MTVIPRKVKREHGEYWEFVDEKRVGGKVVQKYVGYLGKSPESKNEIDSIVRKISIKYDA